MSDRNVFAELKRRNVPRAAAFYAAGAWLLVQVATQVFPFFHISEWVVRWTIAAATVGFPFWIVFAWYYEWTPQGLQRESKMPVGASPSARQQRKNVDRWIIAMLSVAVVLLLANQFVDRRDQKSPAATPGVPKESIAVLPFVEIPEVARQLNVAHVLEAACARAATASASPCSSSARPAVTISGRKPTTARWTISSKSSTRSPARWSSS